MVARPLCGTARRSLSFVARGSNIRNANANTNTNSNACGRRLPSSSPTVAMGMGANEQFSFSRPTITRDFKQFQRQFQQQQQRQHSGQSMRLYASSGGCAEIDEIPTHQQQQQQQQQQLQIALEDYRKEQSESLGKSPSQVLPNNVISRICSTVPPPSTKDELLRVKGLGIKTVNDFGEGILGVLSIYIHDSKQINGAAATAAATATAEPKVVDEEKYDQDTSVLSPDESVAPSTPSYLVDNGETTLQRQRQRHIKLHIALNQFRAEQAKALGKHPGQILNNNVVDRICEMEPLPTTEEELLRIKGLGPKKLNDFGDGILSVVSTYLLCSRSHSHDETKNNTDRIVPVTTERVQEDPSTAGSLLSMEAGAAYYHLAPAPCSTPVAAPARTARATDSNSNTNTNVNANVNINAVAPEPPAQDPDDEINSLPPLDSFAAPAPYSAPFGVDERVGPASSSLDDDYRVGVEIESNHLEEEEEEDSNDPETSSSSSLFSPDAFVAPAPYSAPLDESVAIADPNPAWSTPDDYNDDDDSSGIDTGTRAQNLFEEDSSSGGGDSWDDSYQYVAPAPYSAPLDDYVAPAPYAKDTAAAFSMDSFVAPAPYSYGDDADDYDDEEDYEISEESFGTSTGKTVATTTTTTTTTTSEIEETKPLKISKTLLKLELKDYRIQQKEDGKPAYTVFTNAALDGIYRELPMTESELLDIKGIGPKKVELYGDDILAMVSKYTGSKLSTGNNNNNDEEDLPLPIPEKIDPESLTKEQRRAADWIFGNTNEEDGDDWQDQVPRNVFVTGSAGTGKSHLLKYIVETLRSREMNASGGAGVGVCAPTGVAALIVGGSTLHSFFGIGLGTGTPASILQKVRRNNAACDRIDDTDVLIIDECSMMSSELMETLDMVSRKIRKGGLYRDVPFGNMQVIAFGDFFQLPPVFRNDGTVDRTWRPFCFESSVWEELGMSGNVVELREVQRQEHEDFVELLNKVRIGEVDETDIQDLNTKCLVGPNNSIPTDGILPTKLYVLNKDVDSENVNRLAELKGKEVVCKAIDSWKQSMPLGTPATTKTKMKESLGMEMPEEVRLKVGAQVMLTRNKDLQRNLVNGSRGVVERLVKGPEGVVIPVVRFDTGLVTKIPPVESERFNPDGGPGCLVRKQIPLKLAWAITIHKSQGSTLTRASLDISSAFEYGQVYVALSRVKSLEGLWLERPAELRQIRVSPQVIEFFRGIE